MQKIFTFKKINLLGALISFFLIMSAIFIQTQYNLEPCPLCITQRIIFIIIGCVFLSFAFFKVTKLIKVTHVILLISINCVGVIFSVRHILIQSGWIVVPAECGIDLDYMFDNFPLNEALNLLFRGAGDCSQIDWVMFGVTLPQLALIWYLIFIMLTIFIYKKVFV